MPQYLEFASFNGTGRHGGRFPGGPGGFPRSHSEPRSRKVMKPRIIFPAPGLLHVSPLVTGAPTGVDAPFALHALGALLCRGIPVHAGLRTLGLRLWYVGAGESRGAECDDKA